MAPSATKAKKQRKRSSQDLAEAEESTVPSVAAEAHEAGAQRSRGHVDDKAPSEGTHATAHCVEGGEAALEDERKGRKKKKNKLTDRWGKKIDSGDAFEVDHFEDQGEGQSEPREEDVDPKRIMVGGMPYFITEDDIHEFFHECGTITELDCPKFADTGKFKGIAFIKFKTEEAANKALALDGADMSGRFLKVEICKIKTKEPAKREVYREPPKKHVGCLSAYVGNLAWSISEKELRKFFKSSRIDAIRLAVHKETGGFRGFGIVDFSDDQSLEAAVKLDQKQVLGRPIKVAYSVPKTQNGDSSRQGQVDRGSRKNCYTCGAGGHMSYNCPQKPLV